MIFCSDVGLKTGIETFSRGLGLTRAANSNSNN